MTIDSLEVLFKQELKDIYDAEKRITKALPKMAKAANSEELRTALQEHLDVTKNQITRLDQVFRLLNTKAQAKPCAGMKGILEEGEETLKRDAEESFADLGIIASARKVEHYEMVAYMSLIALAESMGETEAQDLLRQNMQEEQDADRKLEELSKTVIQEAGAVEEEDEEEDEDEDLEMEDEDEKEVDAEEEEPEEVTPQRR